jgi:multidrug efflux pump subunit AcrA (membrane-fusion protein)
MKLSVLVGAMCLTLLGCSEAPPSSVPLYTVQSQALSIVIPATGELESADAQAITTPGRNPMTISWLAEENSLVQKGDIVARFDAEQLLLDSRKEELEMLLLDKDMRQKKAEKNQQQTELDSEKVLVNKEFAFVDAFAIDDLRLYSKLEIIETLSNRDYLGAKEEFIDWKQDSIGEQNQSAVEVLDIRKEGHQAKFQQHQAALAQLEVTAPNTGLLVFDKDWRGEKPRVGQTVFPGSIIAKIPNLDVMQAKVYVLDKDAIGLKTGQKAMVTLDAYPELHFNGTVSSVAGYSRTIKRGNPTKYFELVVTLTDKDAVLQPGSKVSVDVEVDQQLDKMLVPLQAIFNEQGASFVYLQVGEDYEKRTVETAQKNLYFVEIISGLKPGDIVALSAPEQV